MARARSNSNITLLDFEDSFTYNIVGEIWKQGGDPIVIPRPSIKAYLQDLLLSVDQAAHLLIYGPGPGHPEDYQELFELITNLRKHSRFFHLGICLGHQLLWAAENKRVVRSKRPMHGQKVTIKVPSWDDTFPWDSFGKLVQVQRYNSLSLDLTPEELKDEKKNLVWDHEFGECMLRRFDRGLSYQFHPESIGTSCPEVFFYAIRGFCV